MFLVRDCIIYIILFKRLKSSTRLPEILQGCFVVNMFLFPYIYSEDASDRYQILQIIADNITSAPRE